MKQFLKKYAMTLVALVIASVTLMSFELANTANTNTWHFTGNSEAEGQYAEASNWQLGAAPAATCVEEGNKPCEISVLATNSEELANYLDGMPNEEVLDINPNSTRF